MSCKREKQRVIVIQPLGDFKFENAERVANQIRTQTGEVILRQNIPFPKNSYYKPRNRYRADSVIKFLKQDLGTDTIIVGLAKADISTTKGKIKDWGVMGLGYRPGNSCIVSSFRLNNNNLENQFHKVVLHELGHTEGLHHCKEKSCFMRDAEGKNPIDDEVDFCLKCKSHLKKKGWKLI